MRWFDRRNLREGCQAVGLALVGILLLPLAFADQLSVQAQVDRSELKVGETLTFAVTIAGPIREPPKLELTSLEGFQVVSTGQSQQIQLRGKEIEQALTLTYVLAPAHEGTYTLGPVKVEVQGQVYETQPIQVKVMPGPAGRVPGSRQPPSRRFPKLEGGVIL